MSYEPRIFTLAIVPVPALNVLTTNFASIPCLKTANIESISGSLRLLTLGTLVITIKNNAGTTLATVSFTTAGQTSAVISSSAIAAGDSFNFSVTGIATGTDCFISLWMSMAALA